LAEPLSITVFDYGTSELSSDQLLAIVKKNFDLRPGRIVKYATSHYSRGHFPLLFFSPTGI
jgi:S-adenosylmethionine synthetase